VTSSSSWQEYWLEYDGYIQPTMELMADMNDVVADTYTQLRKWLLTDRPDGFTYAQKELLFAILDIYCDHESGAKYHIVKGLAAGLPLTQVREALTMVVMTSGINNFAEIGQEIWKECRKFTNGETAAGGE
jgi:hypothetical protein